MMKKLISTILCLVIVLTSMSSLNVFAENGTLEHITLDVITNESLGGNSITKLESGAEYAVDLFLTTANFVKDRKENRVYLLKDDIKELTRSTINNVDNGYIISQGCLNIKLDRHDNMYTILYSIGSNCYKPLSYNSNNVEIEYVTYNNNEYIEPDVIMSLLSAECTFDIIDGKRTMLVKLPEYTLFEALADMDTEKYFVGDLLEVDTNKDGNWVTNFPQHFINFNRLYNQFGTDILLNLRYEVFNPAGTDYLIRSDMKDAYADIIGYDVYTEKKVADTESKIFSTEKGLESLLKTAVEKKNSKGGLMKFFDSMFLYQGNDSEKMAEVAHKTSENLSKNIDVTSKLNSMGISSAKTILTRTVLEYIKRHSYDQEVLEKFRNTFSEDSRKLVGLNLSQNDNKKYQYAMDYYYTCFNDSELLNEIVEDVVYKNVMKFIVMLPFDWATAGAASKYTGLYEKCLSVEKLRESYDKNFTLNPLDYIKPVNSMNSGMDYIQLTIVQRLIHSVFEKTENEFLNDINLSNEKYKLFTDSLDIYCRTSIVMMNKLKKSWQLGIISQKEIDIINNVDNYISELTKLIYKIENCKLPNMSEDNVLKNKPIEFELSVDGTISGKVVTENSEPIENAKVTANKKEVYTNANGEFSISLPKGNYSLEVTCDGYQTAKIANINVQPGKTTKLNDIVLKKAKPKTYSAADLVELTIPEIIQKMNNKVDFVSMTDPGICFYNDDVFPGMRFWVNNTEYPDANTLSKLKAGKYELSDITLSYGSADRPYDGCKVSDDLSIGMTFADVVKFIGNPIFTVKFDIPPHANGNLPDKYGFGYYYIKDNYVVYLYFVNTINLEYNSLYIKEKHGSLTLDYAKVYKIPNDEWRTLYKEMITTEFRNNHNDSEYNNTCFNLYDVNNDKIPELFVRTQIGSAFSEEQYTIINGKVVRFEPIDPESSCGINPKSEWIMFDHYYSRPSFHEESYRFYKIENGKIKCSEVFLIQNNSGYYIDYQKVSKDDFYTKIAKYDYGPKSSIDTTQSPWVSVFNTNYRAINPNISSMSGSFSMSDFEKMIDAWLPND